MSLGIKHIEILVSDLDLSMIFYGDLFASIGWNKVSDNAFKVGDSKGK